MQQPKYLFIDSLQLKADKQDIVLYAVRFPDTFSGNDFYQVYLAIIQASRNGKTVLGKLDLTEYMPEIMDPGLAVSVRGAINYFVADRRYLHVNLIAKTSGSGVLRGSSDIFLGIDETGRINYVGKIDELSRFGNAGACCFSYKKSNLSLDLSNPGSGAKLIVKTRGGGEEDDRVLPIKRTVEYFRVYSGKLSKTDRPRIGKLSNTQVRLKRIEDHPEY